MSGKKKAYGDILSVLSKKMPGPQGKKEDHALTMKRQSSERISRCAFLTVEAALLMPIFWYALSGFLYFLLIFRLQEDVSQALADAGRGLGQYAYSISLSAESGQIKNGSLESKLWKAALIQVRQKLHNQCTDQAALRLVEGGVSGIQLWRSSIMESGSKIELVAFYELKTPWILLGLDSIPVMQKQVCRAWTGFQGDGMENGQEELVYITPYGVVYHHNLECRYLQLSIHTISRKEIETQRNQSGACYDACESCCKKDTGELLYITDYGSRYHQSLDCIGLKRTIQLVLLSEVKDRSPCKGCSAEE